VRKRYKNNKKTNSMESVTANEQGIIISKKTEKVVSALYLVSELIDDKDPIKHRLKVNAVALLESTATLGHAQQKDTHNAVKMSFRFLQELLSLIEVAKLGGIMSDMNATILKRHFSLLLSALEKRQTTVEETSLHIDNEERLTWNVLEKRQAPDSFDIQKRIAHLHGDKEEATRSEEQLHRERLLELLDKDKRQNIKDTSEKSMLRVQPGGERVSTHAALIKESRTKERLSSSFQMKKLGRRDQILALFVRGVDVSIKDIASRIRGCSEKTIQRELNTLVYDNTLERIGEKRWSRYVLK
jgi:hypothetical protein